MKYFYKFFFVLLFFTLVACSQQSFGPKGGDETSDSENPSITPLDDSQNTPGSTDTDNTNKPNTTSDSTAPTSSVNTVDASGFTPLQRAIQAKNLAQAKSLIGQGADINKAGKWEHTALHSAIIINYLEGVQFLLDNGAQVTDAIIIFADAVNSSSSIKDALAGAHSPS